MAGNQRTNTFANQYFTENQWPVWRWPSLTVLWSLSALAMLSSEWNAHFPQTHPRLRLLWACDLTRWLDYEADRNCLNFWTKPPLDFGLLKALVTSAAAWVLNVEAWESELGKVQLRLQSHSHPSVMGKQNTLVFLSPWTSGIACYCNKSWQMQQKLAREPARFSTHNISPGFVLHKSYIILTVNYHSSRPKTSKSSPNEQKLVFIVTATKWTRKKE